MAGKKREEVTEKDVAGLKYFDKLATLLERLHDDGCQRDKAGNRLLHFDQYVMLVLLFLFNPIVGSLRSIVQASELKKVQRRLGCQRASLGSLSEAACVFDAGRLKGIVEELGAQLEPVGQDARLKDVQNTLTLVDGTLLAALPRMAEASLLKQQEGSGLVKWRLHTQFEVDRYVPTRIDVTRNGGGQADERSVLERNIQSDHCYVMDRGYAKFTLFNKIHASGSSYVCRLRDNSTYEMVCFYFHVDQFDISGNAERRFVASRKQGLEAGDETLSTASRIALASPARDGRHGQPNNGHHRHEDWDSSARHG